MTCLPSLCRAAWVTLLAGLSSGVFSNVLLQPFDVAKTRSHARHAHATGTHRQLWHRGAHACACPLPLLSSLINPLNRSTGMLALFRKIRSESGWLGMWRGVGPAVVRISLVSRRQGAGTFQCSGDVAVQQRADSHCCMPSPTCALRARASTSPLKPSCSTSCARRCKQADSTPRRRYHRKRCWGWAFCPGQRGETRRARSDTPTDGGGGDRTF